MPIRNFAIRTVAYDAWRSLSGGGARLRARAARREAGRRLYQQAVSSAREPQAYRSLGVADTPDGRFDLICLHVVLLTRCLPEALARSVLEALIEDLDASLREAGVGDMGVPRRVRGLARAYRGRALAYAPGLSAADPALLSAALLRNLWRGRSGFEAQARRLAAWALAQQAALAALAGSEPDALRFDPPG